MPALGRRGLRAMHDTSHCSSNCISLRHSNFCEAVTLFMNHFTGSLCILKHLGGVQMAADQGTP